LAPAMAGTDLFTHIRYMVYTTVPTLVITLIIFLIWGFTLDTPKEATDSSMVLNAIENSFNLTPLLFLVPAAVIFMIIKRIPALPALLIGALLGGVFAIIFQPDAIDQVAKASISQKFSGEELTNELAALESNYVKASFISVMNAMTTTISMQTENAM